MNMLNIEASLLEPFTTFFFGLSYRRVVNRVRAMGGCFLSFKNNFNYELYSDYDRALTEAFTYRPLCLTNFLSFDIRDVPTPLRYYYTFNRFVYILFNRSIQWCANLPFGITVHPLTSGRDAVMTYINSQYIVGHTALVAQNGGDLIVTGRHISAILHTLACFDELSSRRNYNCTITTNVSFSNVFLQFMFIHVQTNNSMVVTFNNGNLFNVVTTIDGQTEATNVFVRANIENVMRLIRMCYDELLNTGTDSSDTDDHTDILSDGDVESNPGPRNGSEERLTEDMIDYSDCFERLFSRYDQSFDEPAPMFNEYTSLKKFGQFCLHRKRNVFPRLKYKNKIKKIVCGSPIRPSSRKKFLKTHPPRDYIAEGLSDYLPRNPLDFNETVDRFSNGLRSLLDDFKQFFNDDVFSQLNAFFDRMWETISKSIPTMGSDFTEGVFSFIAQLLRSCLDKVMAKIKDTATSVINNIDWLIASFTAGVTLYGYARGWSSRNLLMIASASSACFCVVGMRTFGFLNPLIEFLSEASRTSENANEYDAESGVEDGLIMAITACLVASNGVPHLNAKSISRTIPMVFNSVSKLRKDVPSVLQLLSNILKRVVVLTCKYYALPLPSCFKVEENIQNWIDHATAVGSSPAVQGTATVTQKRETADEIKRLLCGVHKLEPVKGSYEANEINHYHALLLRAQLALNADLGRDNQFLPGKVGILITGNSGTGKSFAVPLLATALSQFCMSKDEYKRLTANINMEDFVYRFTEDVEHKDGYKGQPVIVQEEAGSTIEKHLTKSNFATLMLSLISSMPLTVNTAKLETKDSLTYDSPFTVATSNAQNLLEIIKPQTTFPIAVLRRFIMLECVGVVDYARNDGSFDLDAWTEAGKPITLPSFKLYRMKHKDTVYESEHERGTLKAGKPRPVMPTHKVVVLSEWIKMYDVGDDGQPIIYSFKDIVQIIGKEYRKVREADESQRRIIKEIASTNFIAESSGALRSIMVNCGHMSRSELESALRDLDRSEIEYLIKEEVLPDHAVHYCNLILTDNGTCTSFTQHLLGEFNKRKSIRDKFTEGLREHQSILLMASLATTIGAAVLTIKWMTKEEPVPTEYVAQSNSIVPGTNIVRTNTYHLYVAGRCLGRVTDFGRGICVAPRHYMFHHDAFKKAGMADVKLIVPPTGMKKREKAIVIQLPSLNSLVTHLSDEKVVFHLRPYLDKAGVPPTPSAIQHVLTRETLMSKISGTSFTSGSGQVIFNRVNENGLMHTISGKMKFIADACCNVNDVHHARIGEEVETVKYSQMLTHTCSVYFDHDATSKSDCGQLHLFNGDKFQNKVILGIHVAGQNVSSGKAALVSMFSDLELERLRSFSKPYTAEGLDTQYMINHGKAQYDSSFQTKTQIIKSQPYDDLVEALGEPQKHPTDMSFEKVDEALLKRDRPEQVLSEEILTALPSVCEHTVNELLGSFAPTPYTFEYAVRTHPDVIGDQAIDRSTSAGAPINRIRLACEKQWPAFKGGKRVFLGAEGNETGPAIEILRELVEAYIDGLKTIAQKYSIENGADLSVLTEKELEHVCRAFTVFPKDECLKPDKLVRLITGSCLVYQVAVRMYFGDLPTYFIKRKLITASLVGINCLSTEEVRMFLARHPNFWKKFFGDFGGFDLSHIRTVLLWIGICIIRFYPVETQPVMYLLWHAMVSARVYYLGTIYEFLSSLPSGHPFTTIINTLCVIIYFKLVWFIANNHDLSSLKTFNENIVLSVYGDDHMGSISPKAEALINNHTLPGLMAQLGLKWTTFEKKSGTDGPRFHELEEGEILSRRFRYDNGVWVMALRKVSIENCLYWTREIDKEGITQENFQNALIEATLHGKEYFSELYRALVPIIIKYGYNVPIRSYECCRIQVEHVKRDGRHKLLSHM